MSVDVSKYYPDVIKDFREFVALASAENPEMSDLWSEIENTMNNQFIQDSDGTGIKKFEKLVDITPYATDTLEERKFRVMAKWNANIPYTERRFIEMLDNLCGEGGYTININRPDHSAIIKVALVSKKNVSAVEDLAERIVPAEMTLSVDLLYNTWGQVKSLTWGALKSLTWHDVKAEVLPNG